MRAAPLVVLLTLAAAPRARAQGEPEADRTWQRLIGILQYLESDYPAAVKSGSPTELAEQSGFAKEALAAAEELGAAAQPFKPRLEAIRVRVEKAEDPSGVARDCAALVEELAVAGGLPRSPHQPPDLMKAEELYRVGCAACHAADGTGQVEIAATMNPRPSSFLDPKVMESMTPYKAFNVETLGVNGTAMPSYSLLDDKDRWAIAFFLLTFGKPPCTVPTPRTTLERLATSTDADLLHDYSTEQVACLRRNMPQTDEEAALLVARGGISDAMRLSASGQAAKAREAVMDAYLNGIEPVEPLMRARDPRLVERLEKGFTCLRVDADSSSPSMPADGRELLGLIDQARRSHSPTNALSVMGLTLIIILREGFEAAVVIAALLAFLKKTEQTRHARVVHLGWILALGLGVAAFVFARHLLAGTRREWLEAIVALAAVGMLLYAALWLNARKNIRKFMGKLRHQMEGALGRGSAAGLFTISFTAMARESFETALFLQGLSIDSAAGVAWGAAAGLVLLVVLVAFVIRVGYRLPMKALFNGSTALLFGTAVVLLGKGLHALQELGALGVRPIPFLTFDFLGIYPDLVSLLPQVLLLLAPLAWWLRPRKPEGPPGVEALT